MIISGKIINDTRVRLRKTSRSKLTPYSYRAECILPQSSQSPDKHATISPLCCVASFLLHAINGEFLFEISREERTLLLVQTKYRLYFVSRQAANADLPAVDSSSHTYILGHAPKTVYLPQDRSRSTVTSQQVE